MRWPAVALASVIGLVGCQETSPLATGEAEVTYVYDGDTFEATVEGQRESIRLIGIDTPETNHPEIGAECFGAEATARLRQLLPEGTIVRLERDVEARDRFDRILAYAYVDDVLINETLVVEGFADARVYGENRALADRLAGAESRARAASLGLWGACGGPDTPLDDR